MIKLYGHPLSGNAHKVRLMLSELNLDYQEITVDLLSGAHKESEFLKINPLGQLPVLVDGETTLRDSQAILMYLARKHNRIDLLPENAENLGLVSQWLSFSANEIQNGPFLARLHFLLELPMDIESIQQKSHDSLKVLDLHLSTRNWLELGHLTIADLACYPYVALAHEGKLLLEGYTNVNAWLSRVKGLPSFVSMPGI